MFAQCNWLELKKINTHATVDIKEVERNNDK